MLLIERLRMELEVEQRGQGYVGVRVEAGLFFPFVYKVFSH